MYVGINIAKQDIHKEKLVFMLGIVLSIFKTLNNPRGSVVVFYTITTKEPFVLMGSQRSRTS